jgi:hypothetical protein
MVFLRVPAAAAAGAIVGRIIQSTTMGVRTG